MTAAPSSAAAPKVAPSSAADRDEPVRAVVAESEIDDALDDSFPASDPPSWWAGGA